MRFSVGHVPLAAAVAAAAAGAQWPNGPFSTSGTAIVDADGLSVRFAGVNWPAAADTMLPEGLQHQSVRAIVSRLAGVGVNSVRLTYAIQMVDQILDGDNDGNGDGDGDKDVTIRKALTDALGSQDGDDVFQKIVENNPDFDESTTRLQVFDAVAAECARQHIYIHLDNHVSKAGWCCSPTDGNSWWGDTYFDTDKWLRGLSYMAEHGKKWPNLMSMSLRNELRQTLNDLDLWRDSYNWRDWYAHVRRGADAVHAANPGVLVFLSGLDSDTNLTALVEAGAPLSPGDAVFKPGEGGDFPGYADKLVLELHAYDNIFGGAAPPCHEVEDLLYRRGFRMLLDDDEDDGQKRLLNRLPLVVSEFGFPQNASTARGDPYAACLMDYLARARPAGWMIWVLAGSYYVREGARGADEPWGLLTADWAAWRAPSFVGERLAPLVNATRAAEGEAPAADLPRPGSGSGSGTSTEDGGSSGASRRGGLGILGGAAGLVSGSLVVFSVLW